MENNERTVTNVLETMERKFETIRGNRNINQLHVSRLENNMTTNLLVAPIIVNEKNEIIDGHHRYEVYKRNPELPIRYIVCKGYGLKEVQVLNQHSRTWQIADFLNGYVNFGNKNYIVLKNFVEETGLNVGLALSVVNRHENQQELTIRFKNGSYTVGDMAFAGKLALALRAFDGFEGWKTNNFVKAFMQVFEHPRYDHEVMKQKLEYRIVERQSKINDYIAHLCEIYNYRQTVKSNRLFWDGKEFLEVK